MRGSQKSSVQSIALDIPNRFFNDNALIAPLPFSGNVRIVAILLVASIITACGGGGSGSGSNQVQVTGIVARGAPAVGAIVSATCQGWSGHAAPTDDSGRYSIAVTGLPCKLSTVLSSDGSILNSMTTEGGIVNLTPFTELVFQLSSGDPNKLPSGLILSQQYLASLGLEIASQENPITISFNTNGLGYDAQLDTFSKLVAETPITGAGSTSQLNAFINSAVVSSVANGDGVSINNRLSSYTQAWNTFWGKFGSSDPFFGIVNGTTKFVATYSTELREKFDQLPREFDNLTNQQTENIAKFVEGWKTCGFQETATTRQCFLGRMSAIVIDFGFHWVGTAVVTTVSVVGAPVEIATEASFKLYKNVTTSMLDAELQSGVINQVEYEAFVSTNDAVADFARIAYDAVSTAKDAAEGIQKVNVGVRTLKNNFAGKNIARISTFAKMRDPFKKMISGTFTGFSSIKGAISGWSQSDKDLFRQYLFQASDELMAAIFGQDSIPTNSPPIAAFTANPISASIGSVITFDGNTSVDPDGTITSYKWDFGDGTSGNGSRVTHTYAVAKSYVVTLTVTDNLSATVNAAKPIIITTTPKPDLVPSAVTVSPATVAPGSTITVNWTITNSGNANAAASTTELRLLAASDAINSTSASLVLGLPTGALAVGASAAPSQVITIPAATAPGSYRIVVASDSGNSIGQSNLANDFSGSSAFTVGPAANAMLTNPSNGHRYEIIVCGTWTQCNVAAKARGGNLVTIRSKLENDWILANFGPLASSQFGFWIGLSAPNGTWSWSSGATDNYTNWAPNEPNTPSTDVFANMYTGIVSPGAWNNTDDNARGVGVVQAIVEYGSTGASALQAKISVGFNYSCALTGAGAVKCWGSNASGQLGDGTLIDSLTPKNVSGLTSGIVAISAGHDHACALTNSGGVKCWGTNSQGELGDGTLIDGLTPKDVSGLTGGVSAISAGYNHTCALTILGAAKCWGRNFGGQLGDGTQVRRLTPQDVSGLTSGVSAITAGRDHSCALTSSGGVKCWGTNFGGPLGDGTRIDSFIPMDVFGLTSGVGAISAGTAHTCAVTLAGGAKCWGTNFFGQVGDGTDQDALTPKDVFGLTSGVSSISAGINRSCAITLAGGAKCWGFNNLGQVGDGTTNSTLTPTSVSGLISGVSAISSTSAHTCTLNTSGTLKCWGFNGFGQLGDGTVNNGLVPMNVVGF